MKGKLPIIFNLSPGDEREQYSRYNVPDENSHKWSPSVGKFTGPGLFQEEVERRQARGESLEDFDPHSWTWKNRGGESDAGKV